MVTPTGLKNSLRYSGRNQHRGWLAITLGACTFAQLALLGSSQHIPAAYAQSYTDEDVSNYARAVFDIEAKRTAAFEEASNILLSADSDVDILETPLTCTNHRMADMPDVDRASKVELLTVLVTFCNEASEVATLNDLTPQRFNEITQAHRDDSELADRIQEAISDL